MALQDPKWKIFKPLQAKTLAIPTQLNENSRPRKCNSYRQEMKICNPQKSNTSHLLPLNDKQKLLDLITEFASTQERENKLLQALEEFKLENKSIAQQLEIVVMERDDIQNKEMNLKKELQLSHQLVSDLEKEFNALKQIVKEKKETQSIGIEVSMEGLGLHASKNVATSFCILEPEMTCTTNALIHSDSINAIERELPLKHAMNEIAIEPKAAIAHASIAHASIAHEPIEKISDLQDDASASSASNDASSTSQIESLLYKAIRRGKNPSSVHGSKRFHTTELKRFLDASKKNALNVSFLFKELPSLDLSLINDPIHSFKHSIQQEPLKMRHESIQTDAIEKPMEFIEKENLNVQNNKIHETNDQVKTMVSMETNDAKCSCQPVISLCPMCTGVNAKLSSCHSEPLNGEILPNLSNSLQHETIAHEKMSTNLESQLFMHETSMVKSLADIVMELEKDFSKPTEKKESNAFTNIQNIPSPVTLLDSTDLHQILDIIKHLP